jgi:hypothetical protein
MIISLLWWICINAAILLDGRGFSQLWMEILNGKPNGRFGMNEATVGNWIGIAWSMGYGKVVATEA